MRDHLQLALLLAADRRCGGACHEGLLLYLDPTPSYVVVAGRADESMAAPMVAWAGARDRLYNRLRTKSVREESEPQEGEDHWMLWESEESDDIDGMLPSQRYYATGILPAGFDEDWEDCLD
jgi:hypothetical protein